MSSTKLRLSASGPAITVRSALKYIVIHSDTRKKQILLPTCTDVGRDSSVGIATRYGLDGPGIETR